MGEKHTCPFDTRFGKQYEDDSLVPLQGCFWYCAYFSKPNPHPTAPTREQAVGLYDKVIKAFEKE
jgi:hypothetical protein